MAITTGQLARRAGVNVETVRYYERRGLLPEPPRSATGYRQYPAEAVARIRFIKRAQRLGFALEEIADLLELRVRPSEGRDSVRRAAERRRAEIEEKIATLSRMREALDRLIADCAARKRTGECPILESLEP